MLLLLLLLLLLLVHSASLSLIDAALGSRLARVRVRAQIGQHVEQLRERGRPFEARRGRAVTRLNAARALVDID